MVRVLMIHFVLRMTRMNLPSPNFMLNFDYLNNNKYANMNRRKLKYQMKIENQISIWNL